MSGAPIVLGAKPFRSDAADQPVRVGLVCMPFAALERPSIQIGLLAAIAEEAGHDASTFHLNIEFAHDLAQLGGSLAREQYDQLSSRRYSSADWYFAAEAFGERAPSPELLLREIQADDVEDGAAVESVAAYLLKIREHVVPTYLDRMMTLVDWSAFDVVGFTSTFQQSAAAFALARRIKRSFPQVTTLFGGANFDGDMGREWVRRVDAIDYVIQGEADVAFPRFLNATAAGADPTGVAGVIARRDGDVIGAEAEMVSSIDANPAPKYAEYFDRMHHYDFVDHLDIAMPFESARGCWWGAKRHCTFCGLNGQTMEFRSKSPARVLNELTSQALEHRSLRFEAVDNILEMDYLDELLPTLADRNRPFSIFYEVKADLTRDQIRLLADSGVDHIQPGIESMHSRVLGLMRKGTRSIWNVNVLRWCRYYGIAVAWNVLWGFPDEEEVHVAEQANTLPLLRHLEPPGGGSRIWLERFSPLFKDREAFPAQRIEPQSFYAMTYPADVDLDQVAYFFDYELERTLPDEAYQSLAESIADWRNLAALDDPLYLLVEDDRCELTIRDRRDGGDEVVHRLHGLDAHVHRQIMDTWRTPRQIAEATATSVDEITDVVNRLVSQRLLFQDGNLFLALALPAQRPDRRGRICELPDLWAAPTTVAS